MFTALIFALLGYSATAQTTYPFQWQNGSELMIFGSGDLAAANSALLPLGLEAIPNNGAATIAVSPGYYKESNFGPFNMTFAAVMARPIGGTQSDTWYFFGMSASNTTLIEQFSSIWGIGVGLSETDVIFGWGVPWNKAETKVGGKAVLRAFMADRWMQDAKPTSFSFDVLSSARGGLVKYHHDCSGRASNKPFDASAGDEFWADPTTELGGMLADMKFQPLEWSVYRTDVGGFTAP